MSKRAIVRWFVDLTNGWNKEIHDAIEEKVQNGYRETFPHVETVDVELIKQIREFYSQRMLITASLLIGAASVLVALVAVLVSVIALFKA